MKLFYTEQALLDIQDCINFLPPDVSDATRIRIINKIFSKANKLVLAPNLGQIEDKLAHIGKSHRRLIEGPYKIIYRIEGETIVVTSVFDSRRDPSAMRG